MIDTGQFHGPILMAGLGARGAETVRLAYDEFARSRNDGSPSRAAFVEVVAVQREDEKGTELVAMRATPAKPGEDSWREIWRDDPDNAAKLAPSLVRVAAGLGLRPHEGRPTEPDEITARSRAEIVFIIDAHIDPHIDPHEPDWWRLGIELAGRCRLAGHHVIAVVFQPFSGSEFDVVRRMREDLLECADKLAPPVGHCFLIGDRNQIDATIERDEQTRVASQYVQDRIWAGSAKRFDRSVELRDWTDGLDDPYEFLSSFAVHSISIGEEFFRGLAYGQWAARTLGIKQEHVNAPLHLDAHAGPAASQDGSRLDGIGAAGLEKVLKEFERHLLQPFPDFKAARDLLETQIDKMLRQTNRLRVQRFLAERGLAERTLAARHLNAEFAARGHSDWDASPGTAAGAEHGFGEADESGNEAPEPATPTWSPAPTARGRRFPVRIYLAFVGWVARLFGRGSRIPPAALPTRPPKASARERRDAPWRPPQPASPPRPSVQREPASQPRAAPVQSQSSETQLREALDSVVGLLTTISNARDAVVAAETRCQGVLDAANCDSETADWGRALLNEINAALNRQHAEQADVANPGHQDPPGEDAKPDDNARPAKDGLPDDWLSRFREQAAGFPQRLLEVMRQRTNLEEGMSALFSALDESIRRGYMDIPDEVLKAAIDRLAEAWESQRIGDASVCWPFPDLLCTSGPETVTVLRCVAPRGAPSFVLRHYKFCQGVQHPGEPKTRQRPADSEAGASRDDTPGET